MEKVVITIVIIGITICLFNLFINLTQNIFLFSTEIYCFLFDRKTYSAWKDAKSRRVLVHYNSYREYMHAQDEDTVPDIYLLTIEGNTSLYNCNQRIIISSFYKLMINNLLTYHTY